MMMRGTLVILVVLAAVAGAQTKIWETRVTNNAPGFDDYTPLNNAWSIKYYPVWNYVYVLYLTNEFSQPGGSAYAAVLRQLNATNGIENAAPLILNVNDDPDIEVEEFSTSLALYDYSPGARYYAGWIENHEDGQGEDNYNIMYWDFEGRHSVQPGDDLERGSLSNTAGPPTPTDVELNRTHWVWTEEAPGPDQFSGNVWYCNKIHNADASGEPFANLEQLSFTDASELPSVSAQSQYVYVVWQDDYQPNVSQIYYKRNIDYGEKGTGDWEATVLLSDPMIPGYASKPCVFATSAGVYAVWEQHLPYGGYYAPKTFFRRSVDGGVTWSPPAPIPAPAPERNYPPYEYTPSVCAWGDDVFVVWQDRVMYGHYEIVANRSLDGGNTWQRYVVGGYEAAQLTYDPEMNPSVSVHGGNNRMFVVWTDSRLNGQQVEENDLYCARVDWPGQGSGSGGTMAGGSRTISGGSVSVSPNPVRDEGLVRFHVARTTSADVSVFDKSGGLVAHLAGGRLAPGWHAVRWDATDTRGVRVAPGVYFVRLAAGTDRAAVKVVVAR